MSPERERAFAFLLRMDLMMPPLSEADPIRGHATVPTSVCAAPPPAPEPGRRRLVEQFRALYPFVLVSQMPALGLLLLKGLLLWYGELNYARLLLRQNQFDLLENLSFYRM